MLSFRENCLHYPSTCIGNVVCAVRDVDFDNNRHPHTNTDDHVVVHECDCDTSDDESGTVFPSAFDMVRCNAGVQERLQ